jgi:hypothetical protein
MKLFSVLFFCGVVSLSAASSFGQSPANQLPEQNQDPQSRVQKQRQRGERHEKRRHRLAQLDTDKDQRISRDEWIRRPKAFDRLDSNHDGFITREEMKALREQRRRRNNANENKPPAN